MVGISPTVFMPLGYGIERQKKHNEILNTIIWDNFSAKNLDCKSYMLVHFHILFPKM